MTGCRQVGMARSAEWARYHPRHMRHRSANPPPPRRAGGPDRAVGNRLAHGPVLGAACNATRGRRRQGRGGRCPTKAAMPGRRIESALDLDISAGPVGAARRIEPCWRCRGPAPSTPRAGVPQRSSRNSFSQPQTLTTPSQARGLRSALRMQPGHGDGDKTLDRVLGRETARGAQCVEAVTRELLGRDIVA